jgi:hypothetical protein
MKTRLQIQKKARTQLLNKAPSTQLVQTRPFDGEDSLIQSNLGAKDSLAIAQKKQDNTLIPSNLPNISVNAPGNPPLAVIQTKMTIGAPGDKYEQEADQMASQVVNQINQPSSIQRESPEEEELQMKPDSIQRESPEEEELQMKPDSIQRESPEEEELQMKPDSIQRESPEEEELQMKPDSIQRESDGAMAASPDIEGAIQKNKGSGQPLDKTVRSQMEQAFNADFSGVKVHHNNEADQINKSIQAKAFTTGQDLFFRQGAYEPNSASGKELLAHELTHVVQQNGSQVQKKQDKNS